MACAHTRGATDFVTKPWQNEKVVATVSTAVELRRSRAETASLRNANRLLQEAAGRGKQEIISESPAMNDVFSIVGGKIRTAVAHDTADPAFDRSTGFGISGAKRFEGWIM